MRKMICVLLATILFVSSISVSAFALTAQESNVALNNAFDAMFATVAGDVNKDNKFDALDARAAMLASLGDDAEINSAAADMDGDGVITTIDVRALLRLSAKLDSMALLYSATDKLNLFNALANDVKATGQKFKYATVLQNMDMSYDNQGLVDKFNKQMNSVPGVESEIDLGSELVKEKGKITYKCNTGLRPATELNYPVKTQDFVSALTLNDISSIDYATNKSYTYTPKRSIGTRVDEYETVQMTGLDVLTVYFKSENITTVPDDTTTLTHGRAFDVPQKADLTSGYEQINGMFAGLEDLIGTMTATFNSLTYHDSSISIYFDRTARKICLVEYNLYYDFSVKLDMDLYFFPFINIDDALNLTDKEYCKNVYCFQENYNSLGR